MDHLSSAGLASAAMPDAKGRKALVTFSEEEAQLIRAAADAEALPIATWIRKVAVLKARELARRP
jgi:hypothetical protein